MAESKKTIMRFSFERQLWTLTPSPSQYMVPLDDCGIDFTAISDYDLFQILLPVFQDDLPILLETDTTDFDLYYTPENTSIVYSPGNQITIDEAAYLPNAKSALTIPCAAYTPAQLMPQS